MGQRLWMVRAGEGGYLIQTFVSKNVVGVGWRELTDLSSVKSLDEMRSRVENAWPERKRGWQALSSGMIFKFACTMAKGDRVVTYDPATREYVLGTVDGAYRFEPGLVEGSPHLRPVTWEARVSRDALSAAARNTLGSVLTIFEPGEEVLEELLAGGTATTGQETSVGPDELSEERLQLFKSMAEQSRQHIEDMLLELDEEELPLLVCVVLRAMGFKARPGPKGADRGRDVIASPDGLGLQHPRIFAEVKARRNEKIGAPLVRSFIAALKDGDRGLYVSSGGFSKEAHYEAERSTIPLTLVDVGSLAALVIEHYDNFDTEGRELVPLQRLYWPRA